MQCEHDYAIMTLLVFEHSEVIGFDEGCVKDVT